MWCSRQGQMALSLCTQAQPHPFQASCDDDWNLLLARLQPLSSLAFPAAICLQLALTCLHLPLAFMLTCTCSIGMPPFRLVPCDTPVDVRGCTRWGNRCMPTPHYLFWAGVTSDQ